MNTKMTIPRGACLLSSGVKGGSTVSGKKVEIVASSGQAFRHWHWKKLVLNLKGMQVVKDRMPILWAHDQSKPLGYFNKDDISINGQLLVRGTLIDSEPSREFVNLASQDFPMEASLYGVPQRIQYVPAGERVEVNGQVVEGEANIWESWQLREVSPAIFGFDLNTEASVFAFTQGEKLDLEVEVLNHQDMEDKRVADEIFAASGGDDSDRVVDADEHMAAQELVDAGECASIGEAYARLKEDDALANQVFSGRPGSNFYEHEVAIEDEAGDDYNERVKKLMTENDLTLSEAQDLADHGLAKELHQAGTIPVWEV